MDSRQPRAPAVAPPDSGSDRPPLVVDLDRTLVLTDTLLVSLRLLACRKPLLLLRLPLWMLLGRAGFKARLAQWVVPAADTLPYRADLIAWLRQEHALGRRLVLATAANRAVAEPIARHLQLFDSVLASDAHANLKGRAKLAQIQRQVGPRFVYAGDSRADLAVWAEASGAVLAGVSPALRRRARALCPIERVFPESAPARP